MIAEVGQGESVLTLTLSPPEPAHTWVAVGKSDGSLSRCEVVGSGRDQGQYKAQRTSLSSGMCDVVGQGGRTGQGNGVVP